MSELIDTSKADKAKQKADKKRERELNDLRKVLSTPEGRRFYWRILTQCRLYKTSFSVTNEEINFKEGKRSIGLWALDELMSASPTLFATMQSEFYSEKKSEDILRQKEENEDG